MLASTSIRSRLVASFILMLLFIAAIGGTGSWGIRKLKADLIDIAEFSSKKVEYSQRLRANINMLRRYEKDLFINIADPSKVDEYKKKWDDAQTRFQQRVDDMMKLAQSEKDKDTVRTIKKNIDNYSAGLNKIYGQIKSGEITSTQDANKAIGSYKEATHQSETMVTEFAKENDKWMEQNVKEQIGDAASLQGLIAVLVFGALTLAVILAVILIRSITKPLAVFLERTTDIAQGEGDLTKRLDDSGNDEIAQVSRMFNLFVEKLHGIISQIASTSTQVAAASSQLNTTAKQIATGAEEVACQAATVATAGEEMSATSGDIARNCQMAAEGARQASGTARNGAAVVQKTVTVMGQIAGKVEATAKTVERLGERSDQIGAIIGTIEDIADQTNLLALNAAIEAARAGEQGRGFAVVADEVRALAERTTKATREISEMIKAIQSETRGAVDAMEQGVQEVKMGTDEAAQSGAALQEILEQVNDVALQINQVATAAEEQTSTTSEISSNMQQITHVVQQTSHGAQESATAAAQLSGNAEELQRLVRQFKL